MKVEASYAVIEIDYLKKVLRSYIEREGDFEDCLNALCQEVQKLDFKFDIEHTEDEEEEEGNEYICEIPPEVREYFDKILLGKRGRDYV